MNAADAFFAIFGMTSECAHAFGAETSKRFRAVDGRMYRATSRACERCGERSETCLLVKGDDGG